MPNRSNPAHPSRRRGFGTAAAQMVAVAMMFNAALGLSAGAARAEAARPLRIVAFGDSLTAGFQLPPRDAFPAQLERALQARGFAVEVINAGVSGDTTAAALDRLAWSVPDGVDAAIVELGANDALRGLDPDRARANLDSIVATFRRANADVLIAGMIAPNNFGPAYAGKFNAMFADLAAKHGALLYPFFLDGVALKPRLSLADGMHPNAAGVAEIVARMLPSVEQLIGRVKARQAVKSGG